MNPIKFGSVCSGIEAASVAWHPLGWRAAWLAEIEPFPSAVLKHHYPDVPNIGDMKKLLDLIPSGEVEAPDVFCGGTPCQAFSVAGLRNSLDDARGNLSLTFCEIANAIDSARHVRGEQPAIVFWENVPGVLSTKDNAFGCFLAGLAGEDDPLVAPGGKWTNAGYVLGPKRAVAWRVLDAQYFGVAQRRRRVFVVASARKDFDPAAVLFEFDGVRRDTAPSRDSGKNLAASAARSVALRGRDGGGTAELGDEMAGCLRASGGGGDKPHVLAALAFGGNNQSGPIDVATARNACASASGRMDFESETFLVQPTSFHPTQDPISSTDGTTHALGCGSSSGQASIAVAFTTEQTPKYNEEQALTLTKQSPTGGGQPQAVMQSMRVRRLTPVECERLQGFPDGYTAIPWRKKPASECPDGPRYKALGNSWAVPNVRWIGKRISFELKRVRQYTGCELNPDYGALQTERIAKATPAIDLFSAALSGAETEPSERAA